MAAILIAEDEPRIAAFVEKGLRAAGYPTTVAGDGRTALEHASSGEFDLMVLDIGLPVLNGFAVLEALRGQGSTLPVIILTARDSVTDTVAGLEGGADEDSAGPIAQLADGSMPDPEQHARGQALARDLQTAVGALEPAYRELMLLRFQEGLAYHEIAAVTGLPLGTVKTRTLLAMKKLRGALRSDIRELL